MTNWNNRTIFHRDNLEVLRGMNSETVDLIATDPPFKKGRDFHATPGSLAAGASFKDRWTWEKDVKQDWVDKISDDWPAIRELVESASATYGEDMAAFLVWMGIRLLEMERVLKPTGSIYLHCDPTASHYLKMLMDAIFTRRGFRNEIVWKYSGWNKKMRHYMERRHDVILFYGMSDASPFQCPSRPWKNKQEYVKRRKQKVHTDSQGREYVLSDGGKGQRVRRYLDDAMAYGVPLDDVWSIPKINNSDKERTGYPTQKPLKLYKRIIRAQFQ